MTCELKIPGSVQRIIPHMKSNSELSYMFTTVEGLMTQYRKAPSFPASIMYFNGEKIVMAVVCPDQEV